MVNVLPDPDIARHLSEVGSARGRNEEDFARELSESNLEGLEYLAEQASAEVRARLTGDPVRKARGGVGE